MNLTSINYKKNLYIGNRFFVGIILQNFNNRRIESPEDQDTKVRDKGWSLELNKREKIQSSALSHLF